MDTIGSYECVCRAGYTGDGKSSCTSNYITDPLNKVICDILHIGIGECLTCPSNADCIYNGRSYNCVCKSGYDGDGTTSCTGLQDSVLYILDSVLILLSNRYQRVSNT